MGLKKREVVRSPATGGWRRRFHFCNAAKNAKSTGRANLVKGYAYVRLVRERERRSHHRCGVQVEIPWLSPHGALWERSRHRKRDNPKRDSPLMALRGSKAQNKR